MNRAMDLLYQAARTDKPLDTYAPDSVYARQFVLKREIMRALSESLTKEQKDWLDEYVIADEKAREAVDFERFCHAFHFGAQIMAELMQEEGKIQK